MPRPLTPRTQNKTLWDEIEDFRLALRLTQSQLAEVLGITRGSYQGYLRRKEIHAPPEEMWAKFESYREESTRPNSSHYLLYWDHTHNAFLRLPGDVNVGRCANTRCRHGRPFFLVSPPNKRFCTKQCKDEARERSTRK